MALVNTNVSNDDNIDTEVENGYNSERGGNSADFEQGRNRKNSEELSEIAGAINSGGKNQTEATRGGNKENYLRGTQSGQNEGRPGERVYVSAGNQKISFVLKEVDDSVAGNAVRILNNIRTKASRQFNKDIGADFSESASFMLKNELYDDSVSILPDMSAAPEVDVIKDDAYAAKRPSKSTYDIT